MSSPPPPSSVSPAPMTGDEMYFACTGEKMYFACTGIVVKSDEGSASILTSASLVRSDDDDSNMASILMIQVRLPNGEDTIGLVAHYDLDYNAAVIIIPSCPDLQAAFFYHHMEFGSNSNVVAVGRWFYSGTSSGESESEECVDEEFLLLPDFHDPLPVNDHIKKDLEPRGYPMPTRLEGGMHLVNTFEEEFVEDTWCKLSKKIKVYLRNKLVPGTLWNYNLEYNVAVIIVMGFRIMRTAEFHNQMQIEPQREVVAVGRVFESGKLMATTGIVTGKESKLDCNELMVTTCKITKAGIGGPLIDLDGNFLGMNFYGMKETNFLPRNIILTLMKRFEAERFVIGKANRWPVPVPRWSCPSRRARRRQKLTVNE
nr:unnamed protein product [Digitaria exilis]